MPFANSGNFASQRGRRCSVMVSPYVLKFWTDCLASASTACAILAKLYSIFTIFVFMVVSV